MRDRKSTLIFRPRNFSANPTENLLNTNDYFTVLVQRGSKVYYLQLLKSFWNLTHCARFNQDKRCETCEPMHLTFAQNLSYLAVFQNKRVKSVAEMLLYGQKHQKVNFSIKLGDLRCKNGTSLKKTLSSTQKLNYLVLFASHTG